MRSTASLLARLGRRGPLRRIVAALRSRLLGPAAAQAGAMAEPDGPDDESRLRGQIGDRYLNGAGIEVGAGARPSRHPQATRITIADKRTRVELESLFGRPIDYEPVPFEQIREPADFIVAHQVLEHAADPIGLLRTWLARLRPDGVVYVSVPGPAAQCEKDRLPTPIEHLLDDHVFARAEHDYESRQHIYSFVHAWAAMGPQHIWYAREDVNMYARTSLAEALRDGHDLHWHTYTETVLRQLIELSFWLEGRSCEWLHVEDSAGSLHVVCRARPRGDEPVVLAAYRMRLRDALARLEAEDAATGAGGRTDAHAA